MVGDNELIRQALIYEGEQAWEHYRHVETQRNQYLGYFFTIVVAGVGLILSLSSRGPAMTMTAIAIVGPLVATLGWLIYQSVVRFRFVLHFYVIKTFEIRKSLLEGWGDEVDKIADGLNVRKFLPESVSGRFSGPQPSSEIVPAVSAVIFGLGGPLGLLSLAFSLNYSLVQVGTIIASGCYSVVLATVALKHSAKVKQSGVSAEFA